MPDRQDITIAPFRSGDQTAARQLILDGLVEHWGWLDTHKNPDLEDIGASYLAGFFLVARCDDGVVGTGAFIPVGGAVVQIVRMSVERSMRRQGLGRRILDELCARAWHTGYRRAVLETTEFWEEVIAFYLRCGFSVTHRRNSDVYFAMDLTGSTGTDYARYLPR